MFFPLSLTVYWLLPEKTKQTAFLVMSVLFLLITDVLSALVITALAAAAALYGKYSPALRKRRILFVPITVLLLFVYAACFIGWSFYQSERFGQAQSFLRFLPFGAAFFILQGVRYIIDVCRNKAAAQAEIVDALGYLLFYPRLAMGPVQSFDEHRAMLESSKLCSDRLGEGLSLFVRGLAKKVLLADSLGIIFSPMYSMHDENMSMLMSWLTISAFSLQLYFTAAGYCEMAKGIALSYGMRMPDSYERPLFSGSFSQFDSKWNITVVSWFKDCFSPLLRSKGYLSAIGTILAWTLAGCWYRPELHIILWGVWIGVWIAIERILRSSFKRIPSFVYGIMFYIAVFLGWTFFSADSLSDGVRRLGLVFGSGASIFQENDLYFIQSGGIMLAIALYSATGHFGSLVKKAESVPALSKLGGVLSVIIRLVLLVLCLAMLATQNDIIALSWKGVM